MLKKIKAKKFIETEEEIDITFPIFRKYITKDDDYICTTYYYVHADFHAYEIVIEEYSSYRSLTVTENRKFEIDNDFYYKKSSYEDSDEGEFLHAKFQCETVINAIK